MDEYDVAGSVEDLHRLLKLMQEYTIRLREHCDEYVHTRYRRIQALAFSSIVLMLPLIAVLFLRLEGFFDKYNFFLSYGMISLMIIITGTFVALVAYRKPNMRESYDIHQVAATVERLVSTASQYRDHAGQKISDRFEFDLRMAEAEAALRVYKNIFGKERRLSFI